MLLLDEPTNGLDAATADRLREILAAPLPQAMAIISHDDGVPDCLTHRCVRLDGGRLLDGR